MTTGGGREADFRASSNSSRHRERESESAKDKATSASKVRQKPSPPCPAFLLTLPLHCALQVSLSERLNVFHQGIGLCNEARTSRTHHNLSVCNADG